MGSDDPLLRECRVDTFRSGGKGGQHQNVTDSGVRLTHTPTGIVVAVREERSQHRNKAIALERLRARLEALHAEKPKRIRTRIPAGAREARLVEKRRRAERKSLRRPPDPEG